MKITVEHIPVETASDEDKWVITTHTENSNMLFYGEISEAVYDALKYQQQQIKELKEIAMFYHKQVRIHGLPDKKKYRDYLSKK